MNFLLESAAATLASDKLAPFWEHWGFEPWERQPFRGVRRLQRFVKDGLLGAVAQYRAIDHILWDCGSHDDRTALWKSLCPIPEVMTQRFFFMMSASAPRKIRSFRWGFCGYAEFYEYRPLEGRSAKLGIPADLADLVDMALRLPDEVVR